MSDIKKYPMFWPSAKARDGVHIAARCQIDGQALMDHGIGWAARTMLQAQEHIIALEDAVGKALDKAEKPAPAKYQNGDLRLWYGVPGSDKALIACVDTIEHAQSLRTALGYWEDNHAYGDQEDAAHVVIQVFDAGEWITYHNPDGN